MKRFFVMLVLTPREQRVAIVFVVMLAAAVVHHRTVAGKLLRLKTINQTGDVKKQLTDDAGADPADDNRK